jgi:hypothetical protein
MKRLLCGALALLTVNALAADCGRALPDTFKKVGDTRLTVYFWDVYDATLFSPSGSYGQSQRYALLLSYLRDIDADDLIDTTKEEWDDLDLDASQHDRWLAQLKDIWPDIEEGNCLLLLETEAGFAEFYQGERLLGTIKDEAFTQQFLAIWLSKNSRFQDERNELIGAQ